MTVNDWPNYKNQQIPTILAPTDCYGTKPGLILAAPASGSGKTLLTLGLLRALRRRGVDVAGAKAGPDYIDPGFHRAAASRDSVNLDAWAMRPETLAGAIAGIGADLVLCEGVMGLFDGGGAAGDRGSTADLAALAGWPVVLVVDVRGQSASVAALLQGFAAHRADVALAGVIFNRVSSPRHAAMLRTATAKALPDLPILGAVPNAPDLALPSRHLGLVQAEEHAALDAFLDRAADIAAAAIDLDALVGLARPARFGSGSAAAVPPPGQRIAVARDRAFSFLYPHLLEAWRQAGADLTFFSPLADAALDPAADAVFLPGGYPELHAGALAAAGRFKDGLRRAAARQAAIYGECGGYMALGEALIDAGGVGHAMAGLLPVVTSFAAPRRHLGYRQVTALAGKWRGRSFRGHEFHFAEQISRDAAAPLFSCCDSDGLEPGVAGAVSGSVAGSFIHLIDGLAVPAPNR
jgi:cobyrinic acid a,c-diamide synthase